MNDFYSRIQAQYLSSSWDSLPLFQAILDIRQQIGLDQALAILEYCVIEKRKAWVQANYSPCEPQKITAYDGYHWFYEKYLGVSIPQDGEIVEQTETRIVSRWWNDCPTLEACNQLGLDTRQVCKLAYHKPVDIFLKQIHPQLQFIRNYACIRPHVDCCEEIIEFNA
jgi:hypothetical protein